MSLYAVPDISFVVISKVNTSYIIMSFEYLEYLCYSDWVHYMSKLTPLSAETCLYKIPTGLWINDPTKWLGIEWPDVSYYLIETPGVFTRESMSLAG